MIAAPGKEITGNCSAGQVTYSPFLRRIQQIHAKRQLKNPASLGEPSPQPSDGFLRKDSWLLVEVD